MNDQTIAMDALMHGRLDRLVIGDLADDERQALLAWLDEDVTRWRNCALAFLEAQVWEEALSEPVARGQEPGDRRQETGDRRQETGDRRRTAEARRKLPTASWLMPLAVIAASIVAFACGTLWRGMHSPPQPRDAIVDRSSDSPDETDPVRAEAGGPLLASVPVTGGPLGNVAAVLQFPVLPAEAAQGQSTSISDSVRRQWERRGYELKEERRYLPAKLPDGRQVMVPVNEVKMKFVGRPVS